MSKTSGFDISNLERNDTSSANFIDPRTQEELPVIITVYSEESPIGKAAAREMTDAIVSYSRKHGGKPAPSDRVEELQRKKMIKVTKSIEGLTAKGQPLTDVAEIFALSPDIYYQAIGLHKDDSRFFKNSPAQ